VANQQFCCVCYKNEDLFISKC